MTDGITSARTSSSFVRAIADAYDDRPAVSLGHVELSYSGLDRQSSLLARALLAHGVGKGTRVGILLPDGPRFAIAWFAATRIGAVAVPISTFYKARELGHVVRHADLHALILQRTIRSQDFVAQLESAFPTLRAAASREWLLAGAPYLRWVAVFGDESGDAAPVWAHDESSLGSERDRIGVDDELLREVESEVHPSDVATMIYTSGQSADPKGVPHTHGGMMRKVHNLTEMMGLTHAHEPGNSQPFFWVGGLGVTLLCTLAAGGHVRCSERPVNPAPPLGAIRRAGEPAPPLPGWKAYPGLGMSETFAMYGWGSTAFAEGRLPYTPMDSFEPDVDVKVVDANGVPVQDGVSGEICVRGPSVTPGHYKVDRARTFDRDGYFHTGDEGVFEYGTLHFLGRLGDMIKTSGANVAPPEVERALVELDGVERAAVVAIPDPERGQLVGAALVAAPSVDLDVRAIVAELRERISTYKVPRIVAVVTHDEIPLTATNKVDKRTLAALIAERGVRP